MNYSLPKKRHCSSFDNDIPGLPRKRFVSEESFAKDMAAMSLDPGKLTTTNTSKKNHFKNKSCIDQPVPIQHIFADTEMVLDMHGKPIIDIDQNGLPIEIRPGDNKPRIPQFVLQNPE